MPNHNEKSDQKRRTSSRAHRRSHWSAAEQQLFPASLGRGSSRHFARPICFYREADSARSSLTWVASHLSTHRGCPWRHGFDIELPLSRHRPAFCFSRNTPARRVASSCCCGCSRETHDVMKLQYSPASSMRLKWYAVASRRFPQTSSRFASHRNVRRQQPGRVEPCGQVHDEQTFRTVRVFVCEGISCASIATA